MSFSDSGSSSNGGDYKTFRQITRERLLYEMLRPEGSKSTWKVLVVDNLTVKILSSACKMSEFTQQGISLVEIILNCEELCLFEEEALNEKPRE